MERVAGFIVVGFFLVVASDFDTTAPLAVAFAYLILLSAALVIGPSAFGNINATLAKLGKGSNG